MDDVGYWPIVIVTGFVAFSATHRRLVKAAQPLRLELAEKGERLLAHPGLPVDMREFVESLLDSAFSSRGTLLLGIFLVPVLGVIIVANPSYFQKLAAKHNPKNREAFVLYNDVMRLHDKITLANHPILYGLTEFEIVMLIPLAIIVGALLRGSVVAFGSRETVLTIIESERSRLHHGRKAAA